MPETGMPQFQCNNLFYFTHVKFGRAFNPSSCKYLAALREHARGGKLSYIL